MFIAGAYLKNGCERGRGGFQNSLSLQGIGTIAQNQGKWENSWEWNHTFLGNTFLKGCLVNIAWWFMVHWFRIKFPRNKISGCNSIAWTIWLIKSTISLSSSPFQLGKANNNFLKKSAPLSVHLRIRPETFDWLEINRDSITCVFLEE